VFRVRDGRVARVEEYLDTAQVSALRPGERPSAR